MATTLYLRTVEALYGYKDPLAGGVNTTGTPLNSLNTTRGATSGGVAHSTTSVASATAIPLDGFVSLPLSAGVTISGTITNNIWGLESSMSANAQLAHAIYRIDGTTGATTLVSDSARGTELGTSNAAQNWTTTPTSTAFAKGDRILVIPYFKNIGTMGGSYTLTHYTEGNSAGASGDSYVTFNENLTFQTESEPSGSTLYLTTTASTVNVGSTFDEKEMWTSRSDSTSSPMTSSVAGPTDPFLATNGTGANGLHWYSRPLSAFTLSGLIATKIKAEEGGTSINVSCFVEIAIVDGDGTNAVVFASGYRKGNSSNTIELGTGINNFEAVNDEYLYLSGPDISVTDGQRLRLRILWDDVELSSTGRANMASASYARLYYGAASSGDINNDSFLTFSQTVTEASSATVYRGHGQAQTKIKAFGISSFAQAQARIKTTYIVVGQAKSSIKQTYGTFAQAQAKIQKSALVYAQARASIKSSGRGTAQAQARIKATYRGFAQAQACIKATYYGFGQARTQVQRIGQGFAQARAKIKATYLNSGQARANIKTRYTVAAQAQAQIQTSSAPTTRNVSAQAMAFIYIPQYSRPIADDSNTGLIRVVI